LVDGSSRVLELSVQGYEPFISTDTIHQLHIFVVVLALVHVVCSCLTMLCALFRVGTSNSSL
jgi:mlo protein